LGSHSRITITAIAVTPIRTIDQPSADQPRALISPGVITLRSRTGLPLRS